MLLEGMDQEIDAMLDPVLLKQVHRDHEGVLSITIGDSSIEYNENFRFYMTTKLPRPHYSPETSVKVTLVNFIITPNGLEDQLLRKVVQFEERELEERMAKFVKQGVAQYLYPTHRPLPPTARPSI